MFIYRNFYSDFLLMAAMGPTCVPGEPKVGVGFFSDTKCGQDDNSYAITYLASSNYVCSKN